MLQTTLGNGLSFDPFSFGQNGWPASEIDVGRGEIIDALVIARVIVVVDKGGDLGLKIAGQEIVSNKMRFFSVWCQRSILPWVIG